MKTSNKQAGRWFVFLLAALLFLTSPLADALPSEGRGLCANLRATAIAEEEPSPEQPPAPPADPKPSKTSEEKPAEAPKAPEEKPAEAPKAPEEKPPEPPKASEEKPTEAPKAPEEKPAEPTKAPEEKPSGGESSAPSSAPEVSAAPDSGENPPAPDAPTDAPETGASPDATLSPDASAAPEGSVSPSDTPNPDETLNPDESVEPTATVDPNTEDQSPDGGEESEPLVMCRRVSGTGWYGVIPNDGLGMPVPILYQGDYRETVCMIGDSGRSVATSGCGATSASMVIAYVTGDTSQNPYTLFYDAVAHGRYGGSGLGHDTISWLLSSHGVSSTWIANTSDGIRQALEGGNPIIAHMGPGIFTTTGHYIVLRGLTDDGKVLVNDPASPSRTHTTYSIDTLLKQARESNSFLVCWSNKPLPTKAPSAPSPEPSPDMVGEFGMLPLPIAGLEGEAT